MPTWNEETYNSIYLALLRALPQVDKSALHDAARDVMDVLPERTI